jgi:hypothetical protein
MLRGFCPGTRRVRPVRDLEWSGGARTHVLALTPLRGYGGGAGGTALLRRVGVGMMEHSDGRTVLTDPETLKSCNEPVAGHGGI